MSNDILDAFLSDIDTIKGHCDEQLCCGKCILNDYCHDVPTRSSFEAGVRAANKAVELIRGRNLAIKSLSIGLLNNPKATVKNYMENGGGTE